MDLKEHLIAQGYDHIDILLVDEDGEQSTVADISLPKVTDLEFKLYLEPESITYHFKEEDPYFEAEQQQNEDESGKKVKGFILEW
ncbi:hypothetical protein [Halobacillus karajensis]|uniref:Uncharacterized protein n=1 Tax=Halobacillus karajensis TaxID=195088 RepID=A0A059NXR9_9BACI|nr:hypothetical protein [Halobacillus karajensis]CDQ18370.1 hypothetical protein BN982_00637 [Halobacillus karajensis]CDQ23558.1 hypothetical protein BN983_01791 [Halobacillus karajensis]CDQ27040.1 hypothetical protein BN981_01271 [Halobacillus karajensis]